MMSQAKRLFYDTLICNFNNLTWIIPLKEIVIGNIQNNHRSTNKSCYFSIILNVVLCSITCFIIYWLRIPGVFFFIEKLAITITLLSHIGNTCFIISLNEFGYEMIRNALRHPLCFQKTLKETLNNGRHYCKQSYQYFW